MRRTDTASRVVHATPQAIYEAFVDPEAQVRWLPPAGMTGRFDLFEPHAGGRYRMTLTFTTDHPGAGKTSADSDTVEGRFIELIPGERIVQTADFESDDPRFAGTMTMIWTLRAVSEGTEVTITAQNVPPGISAEDHATGLASSLAHLAAFVE